MEVICIRNLRNHIILLFMDIKNMHNIENLVSFFDQEYYWK